MLCIKIMFVLWPQSTLIKIWIFSMCPPPLVSPLRRGSKSLNAKVPYVWCGQVVMAWLNILWQRGFESCLQQAIIFSWKRHKSSVCVGELKECWNTWQMTSQPTVSRRSNVTVSCGLINSKIRNFVSLFLVYTCTNTHWNVFDNVALVSIVWWLYVIVESKLPGPSVSSQTRSNAVHTLSMNKEGID